MINFNDIESIKKSGFSGFVTIESLMENSTVIPNEKGIYLVLRTSQEPCEYLEKGTGGFFKKRDPNIPLSELLANWVDSTLVVYIGKAGSDKGNATLRSRLRQYLKFGQGRNIGHWGGRLIWQLKDAPQLLVCWKALPDDNPREFEKQLIKDFVAQYGKRPFANLAD